MDSEFFRYYRYSYIVFDYQLARLYFELFAVRSFHGLTSF